MTLLVFLFTIIISTTYSQEDIFPNENHFEKITQLTFGGENAEAYFSFDEKKIVFQSTRDSFKCDQIFSMDIDGNNLELVSNGFGRTTCAYYFPNEEIIFSSTHHKSIDCPKLPDFSQGYVWPINPNYDIFIKDKDGNIKFFLEENNFYDAEATVSPTGDKIIFTSTRDGDLNLYSMNIDGKNLKQLTNEIGYDGGAFFSFDGNKIVYRAYHPKEENELKKYKELLQKNLVKPSIMEIWIMDADGSNKQQLTNNKKANFAPFFHPNGKQIIFSSNVNDTTKYARNFDLYMIDIDGNNLEQITFNETFDSFPMFTQDGKKLIFASNRNAKIKGETNIFIVDWK